LGVEGSAEEAAFTAYSEEGAFAVVAIGGRMEGSVVGVNVGVGGCWGETEGCHGG
jgi:hypothetical protein